MFGPPGCIYLYRSYGIHVLLNLVCDEEGVGSAVLIRSFRPMGSTDVLRDNRGLASPRDERKLSCGPGRVGQALGLHFGLNGLNLGEDSGILVIDDGERPEVRCTTRVGISRGSELPLRYYLAGSVFVSGSTRSIGGGKQ
jgi:DNA-3-methyladenine glycosylase